MLKNFSLKFIDIMVGIVLGLGFQWWPELHQPWQYLAFVFVYLDIIDYWIDYGTSLKKWPPKYEIDVILDVGIMFALFLYIYATQLTFTYFLLAFVLLKVLDFFWLLSSKIEFRPTGKDGIFIQAWLASNVAEVVVAGIFLELGRLSIFSTLSLLIAFIATRFIIRILASIKYKQIHFA